jgi:hypothetical protein
MRAIKKAKALEESSSERTLTPTPECTPGADIKGATQARRNAAIVSSFLSFLSVIFLLLVSLS